MIYLLNFTLEKYSQVIRNLHVFKCIVTYIYMFFLYYKSSD